MGAIKKEEVEEPRDILKWLWLKGSLILFPFTKSRAVMLSRIKCKGALVQPAGALSLKWKQVRERPEDCGGATRAEQA